MHVGSCCSTYAAEMIRPITMMMMRERIRRVWRLPDYPNTS